MEYFPVLRTKKKRKFSRNVVINSFKQAWNFISLFEKLIKDWKHNHIFFSFYLTRVTDSLENFNFSAVNIVILLKTNKIKSHIYSSWLELFYFVYLWKCKLNILIIKQMTNFCKIFLFDLIVFYINVVKLNFIINIRYIFDRKLK